MKLKQLGQKWDNLERWVKRLLTAFAIVGTIVGSVSGVTSWTISQIDTRLESHIDVKIAEISKQADEIERKSDAADRQLLLSSTRSELIMLISYNPENVLEIEKVARYYFRELDGDWYMSGLYSDWAKQYGGDTTFIVH